MPYKAYKETKNEPSNKQKDLKPLFEDSGIWLNMSKSGKALTIVIPEKAERMMLVAFKDAVLELMEGKRRGIMLKKAPEQDA